MRIFKVMYAISVQFLFAIINAFLIFGIWERNLLITSLSFAARSCLHWMSIEIHIVFSQDQETSRE